METTLVDTHCHLAILKERGLLDQALESAKFYGVRQIVSVGLNLEDSYKNSVIAEENENVFFSVGWHPHQSEAPDHRQIQALGELLAHPKAVAVGEIGLDKFWRSGYHEVPLEVQIQSMNLMMELAEQYRKPVIVHNRDANTEILGVFNQWPKIQGVMHCFVGSTEFAKQCVGSNMMLSISGIVTFADANNLRLTVKEIPDDHLLVETDSPFLAPVPHRGEPNLPGYVYHTAVRIAEIKNQPVEILFGLTSDNAQHLFNLH